MNYATRTPGSASPPLEGWLTPERLRKHVQLYILARLGITFAFSLSVATQGMFWAPVFDLANSQRISSLVVLTLAVMGLSAAGLSRSVPVARLAWLQLLVDGVVITSLVLLTGGALSPFAAFYVVSVVAAAWLVYQRGVFITAGFYALITVVLALVEARGVLLSSSSPAELFTLSGATTVRIFGFFLAAILAGRLTEQLRNTELALVKETRRTSALEQDLAQLVDSLRSGLALIGPDGRLRSANRIALEQFPELADRPAQECIPGYADQSEGAWEVGRNPDEAHSRYLLISRSPLQDGGSVLTIEDVSRLRRMELAIRQQERLSAVGRFAAGVAHEVRNPLTSLSGAVQLLQVTEEDKPLRDIILKEVDRINRLVSDFLQAARPPEPHPSPTDLRALVREVVETFGKDARYAERVRIESDLAAVPEVDVDPDQIRQIVWNILLNAAQAMPERGAVQVRLVQEGDGVTLAVRDEGVGIPEEDLARIFDPFYTTRSGGTGLGLATVKRVVDAHCGLLRVRSRPGLGTTFAVWLPRVFVPPRSALP